MVVAAVVVAAAVRPFVISIYHSLTDAQNGGLVWSPFSRGSRSSKRITQPEVSAFILHVEVERCNSIDQCQALVRWSD